MRRKRVGEEEKREKIGRGEGEVNGGGGGGGGGEIEEREEKSGRRRRRKGVVTSAITLSSTRCRRSLAFPATREEFSSPPASAPAPGREGGGGGEGDGDEDVEKEDVNHSFIFSEWESPYI